MSGMRFLPVHRQALMVELDDLQQTLVLLQSLQAEPIDGVQELVPAARTILVYFAPHRVTAAQLVQAIAGRNLQGSVQRSDVLVEIPVRYDGEDLADVAQMLGISAHEVVQRHTGSEWSVAFTGFAPGFAYLSGGDPIFNVARRTTPRTKVPAGAVALAGLFSAVYPQASPGGWQIIGVTDAAMWDLSRDLPALLQPGYRVRFVDASTVSAAADPRTADAAPVQAAAAVPSAAMADTGQALRVRATGLLTVFQDRGRHGQAGQGVSASGAMDQAAFKSANRLVGNASHLPVLETVGGGLVLQSVGENVVAVTGADAPLTITTAAGRHWHAPRYAAIALADGDSLGLGQPTAGARCYVAVRGGYRVAPVLGSASTDTLAQVGPPALHSGQLLPVEAALHAVVGDAALAPDLLPAPRPGGGAGCGTGPAHRLVHARGRGPAGQSALAGHAPVQPGGPAPGRRRGLGACRHQRAAQRRHGPGRHPGACQRPAGAVPGGPPPDRGLPGDRLCGPSPSGSGGADPGGCMDSF